MNFALSENRAALTKNTTKFRGNNMINKYIKIAALWLSILIVPTGANATLIFENSRDASASDAGAFSQGNQILVREFSLAAGAVVNRSTWYGTMFSSDPLNTGDTWNFDIVFRANSGGLPGGSISTSSVAASVIDTGLNIGGERVYIFDAVFTDIALAESTSYFLSVINTGTQDTFRWNVGLDNSFAGYFSQDGGASWRDGLGSRAPLNFALYDGRVSVPEPTSMVLLVIGLAGIGFARKKKK